MVTRTAVHRCADRVDEETAQWHHGGMEDVDALVQGTALPRAAARHLIRLSAGVGQAELARVLGVSRWSIRRWELGQNEPLGDTRRRYAAALHALRAAGEGRDG